MRATNYTPEIDEQFAWPGSYNGQLIDGKPMLDIIDSDDDTDDIRDCIGYHDRPMTQEDQAQYDAYMAREQAHVAAAMGRA